MTAPAAADTFRPVTDQLRITLAGMRFHVRVGILPHERELPQPLELDLSVWGDAARTGGRQGEGAAVLDYRGLYAAAAEALAGGPLHCLEEIAERVADGALALRGVARARVAVRKPHVALDGPLAYAEIELERSHAGRPGGLADGASGDG